MEPTLRDRVISRVGAMLARLFPQRLAGAGSAPANILVLKPCCLGDVVLATAVVRELRLRLPDARISFAVGGWSRSVVVGNPRLDAVVDCGRVGSGPYSLGEYLHLVRLLRSGDYDCCFVLERSLWLTSLPWLAGIPLRVGLDSEGRGFALNVRVPVVGVKHEAELYLDTLRAVGIEPEEPRTEFFPGQVEREKVDEIVRGRNLESEALAVIHPGGGVNPGMSLPSKRWLPKRFAAIADRLHDRGYTVVLVGGPTDEDSLAGVRAALHWAPIDLSGRLSFSELGALFARCRLFIGNDTGAMHLAGAVGTPVVAAFGPSDYRMYGPYGPRGIAVHAHVPCSPCFQRGGFPPCDDEKCMASIAVDDVWQAVESSFEDGQAESAAADPSAEGPSLLAGPGEG